MLTSGEAPARHAPRGRGLRESDPNSDRVMDAVLDFAVPGLLRMFYPGSKRVLRSKVVSFLGFNFAMEISMFRSNGADDAADKYRGCFSLHMVCLGPADGHGAEIEAAVSPGILATIALDVSDGEGTRRMSEKPLEASCFAQGSRVTLYDAVSPPMIQDLGGRPGPARLSFHLRLEPRETRKVAAKRARLAADAGEHWLLQMYKQPETSGADTRIQGTGVCGLGKGKVLQVHRHILSCKLEYFRTLFSGAFKEKDDEVVYFPDISSDALEIVVEYLYGAPLPAQKLVEEYGMLLCIWGFAAVKMIPGLKSDCELLAVEYVRRETFCECFRMAFLLEANVSVNTLAYRFNTMKKPSASASGRRLHLVIAESFSPSEILALLRAMPMSRGCMDLAEKWLWWSKPSDDSENLDCVGGEALGQEAPKDTPERMAEARTADDAVTAAATQVGIKRRRSSPEMAAIDLDIESHEEIGSTTAPASSGVCVNPERRQHGVEILRCFDPQGLETADLGYWMHEWVVASEFAAREDLFRVGQLLAERAMTVSSRLAAPPRRRGSTRPQEPFF